MSGVTGRTIDVMDVAGYLVAHSDKAVGGSICNLRLQKLLYYSQGFGLAIRGYLLFDEAIEAWDYGPVVRRVNRRYRNGARPIERPAEFESDGYLPEDRELLDAILATYGQLRPRHLIGMTHAEPPWHEAFNRGRNTPLDRSTMHAFFSELVEASRQGQSANGRPIFPVDSFGHQRRRELSDRMERHRAKLRTIASRPRIGPDPWADDED